MGYWKSVKQAEMSDWRPMRLPVWEAGYLIKERGKKLTSCFELQNPTWFTIKSRIQDFYNACPYQVEELTAKSRKINCQMNSVLARTNLTLSDSSSPKFIRLVKKYFFHFPDVCTYVIAYNPQQAEWMKPLIIVWRIKLIICRQFCKKRRKETFQWL